jgi:hypothetical protein
MSKIGRKQRTRLHPYVDTAVAERFARFRATHGLTESAAVQASICQYLDGTSDAALVLRRLDRLGRADERKQRDLEILSLAFTLWMKLWFAHTPNVADDARPFAKASAEARHREFLQHVAEQYSGGHRFIDDLPHEVIADSSELTRLATRSSFPPEPAQTPAVENDKLGRR